MVSITIVSFTNEHIELDIDIDSTSVWDLKKMLEKRKRLSPDMMCLVYKSESMQNPLLLSHYSVIPGAYISLTVNMSRNDKNIIWIEFDPFSFPKELENITRGLKNKDAKYQTKVSSFQHSIWAPHVYRSTFDGAGAYNAERPPQAGLVVIPMGQTLHVGQIKEIIASESGIEMDKMLVAINKRNTDQMEDTEDLIGIPCQDDWGVEKCLGMSHSECGHDHDDDHDYGNACCHTISPFLEYNSVATQNYKFVLFEFFNGKPKTVVKLHLLFPREMQLENISSLSAAEDKTPSSPLFCLIAHHKHPIHVDQETNWVLSQKQQAFDDLRSQWRILHCSGSMFSLINAATNKVLSVNMKGEVCCSNVRKEKEINSLASRNAGEVLIFEYPRFGKVAIRTPEVTPKYLSCRTRSSYLQAKAVPSVNKTERFYLVLAPQQEIPLRSRIHIEGNRMYVSSHRKRITLEAEYSSDCLFRTGIVSNKRTSLKSNENYKFLSVRNQIFGEKLACDKYTAGKSESFRIEIASKGDIYIITSRKMFLSADKMNKALSLSSERHKRCLFRCTYPRPSDTELSSTSSLTTMSSWRTRSHSVGTTSTPSSWNQQRIQRNAIQFIDDVGLSALAQPAVSMDNNILGTMDSNSFYSASSDDKYNVTHPDTLTQHDIRTAEAFADRRPVSWPTTWTDLPIPDAIVESVLHNYDDTDSIISQLQSHEKTITMYQIARVLCSIPSRERIGALERIGQRLHDFSNSWIVEMLFPLPAEREDVMEVLNKLAVERELRAEKQQMRASLSSPSSSSSPSSPWGPNHNNRKRRIHHRSSESILQTPSIDQNRREAAEFTPEPMKTRAFDRCLKELEQELFDDVQMEIVEHQFPSGAVDMLQLSQILSRLEFDVFKVEVVRLLLHRRQVIYSELEEDLVLEQLHMEKSKKRCRYLFRQ